MLDIHKRLKDGLLVTAAKQMVKILSLDRYEIKSILNITWFGPQDIQCGIIR
jgi:hypothetical protein